VPASQEETRDSNKPLQRILLINSSTISQEKKRESVKVMSVSHRSPKIKIIQLQKEQQQKKKRYNQKYELHDELWVSEEVSDSFQHGARLKDKGGEGDFAQVHAVLELLDHGKDNALGLIIKLFLVRVSVCHLLHKNVKVQKGFLASGDDFLERQGKASQ